MLNITDYKRNANQNYHEIDTTSPQSEWPSFISPQITSAGGAVGTLLHCWWECQLVQPLWRTVWRYLRNLHIELPYDPTIPLLGIYPNKTLLKRDTCTRMFIAALFTIARTWKQPKCPSTDDWIRKVWYIYTMEYYSAIKKEWHNAICSNMDGTRESHTE
uniref:Uncharacterized protein n=2 Tax=Sus scrofa TaxID=9823 RepID=A0A8D1ZG46_PIG